MARSAAHGRRPGLRPAVTIPPCPHLPLVAAERALLEEHRKLTREEALAVAHLPLDELPSRDRTGTPGAPGVVRARGGAREPDQRQVGRVPRRLRVLLAVGSLPHRRRRVRLPRHRRDPRRRARDPRCGRDPVLHRRGRARTRGAAPPPGHRRGRRRAPRDRPRGRVLARAAEARAGRAARGGRRAPLQPQPRSVPGALPADLHHAPYDDRVATAQLATRRRHGAVLRRDPRYGRDARSARRLRVRAGRARPVRSPDQPARPPARNPARRPRDTQRRARRSRRSRCSA